MKLFPCVGMKKQPPVHLTANFGQQPFVFDIDGMVKVCPCAILAMLTPAEREVDYPFGDQPNKYGKPTAAAG